MASYAPYDPAAAQPQYVAAPAQAYAPAPAGAESLMCISARAYVGVQVPDGRNSYSMNISHPRPNVTNHGRI
jgi:hypothetical protein